VFVYRFRVRSVPSFRALRWPRRRRAHTLVRRFSKIVFDSTNARSRNGRVNPRLPRRKRPIKTRRRTASPSDSCTWDYTRRVRAKNLAAYTRSAGNESPRCRLTPSPRRPGRPRRRRRRFRTSNARPKGLYGRGGFWPPAIRNERIYIRCVRVRDQ